jgi:mercuric reductase
MRLGICDLPSDGRVVVSEARWALEVAGMTCAGCARHVAEAIAAGDASDVQVDWRAGQATFSASQLDEAGLREAVREAGYPAGILRELRPSRPVGRGDGTEWDVAILGSGSAAFAAAIRASEQGARVVLFERGTPGGTCVNMGCVPSKALLRAAELNAHARRHAFAGIPHLTGPVDLGALVAQKDELVGELRHRKYLDLAAAYGFTLQAGTARFIDEETVEVDGQVVQADRYLIATGASPALPPIEGLAEIDYLTSTTALEITEVPASLAVIGANAIGLELGQLFAQLGAQVTFLDIADRVAPFEEPEISAAFTRILEDDGATVIPNARITRVARADGRIELTGDLGGRTRLAADRVLVATGRRPNTDGLGLDAAGVKVDPRGFVVVDEFLQTSNPRIWAAGDVTPSPQFVYVAAAQGAAAAENALGARRSLEERAVPRVTFTSPQIAAVGLTEADARAAGHEVATSTVGLDQVPRAIVNRDTRGLIKLVAAEPTGRLLGVHVLADSAGEVIQAGVYALLGDMTIRQLADAFHPYLTVAEGLKLAAQGFDRDVTKLSCCAA